MSIPVLNQVYTEVRRLSIAGSVVAPADFRLKKLVAPLEQAGQKAPVFARVAQAVTKLVGSDDRTSAEALLELSTLINAILYTQGATGHAGNLTPIPTVNFGHQQTRTSARVLKPLFEALSSKGSGRTELIKDAFESGSFRDLRLVSPALAAIDDGYPEIGDFIADTVLPLYGPAILPELREKLDLKGRGGDVRRLRLMHRLDPQGTREIVKRALDEGSKEMRVQAIACLGQHAEDLAFLLDQARSKNKEVRQAAFEALGALDQDQAIETLSAALAGNDLELVAPTVRKNRNPQLLSHLLERIETTIRSVLDGKEKDKAKLEKQVARLLVLLRCLQEREDKETEDLLLRVFEDRDRFDAVKGDSSGQDVRLLLAELLSDGSKKLQSALVEAHATLGAGELGHALLAACRSRSPENVFDLFSPYLAVRGADAKKKKAGDKAAAEKADAVVTMLKEQGVAYLAGRRLVRWEANWDPRWLDMCVERNDLELVRNLVIPGHAGASKLLWDAFEAEAKKTKDRHGVRSILEALIRVEHPGATDAVIRTIQKEPGRYSYDLWWVTRLIPMLPKSAVPKLEAILTSLPANVVDYVLDCTMELKNRAEE